MITDFVTGKEIPNVGAEENRQMVARFLVKEKGFSKEDIEIDHECECEMEYLVSCPTSNLQSTDCFYQC